VSEPADAHLLREVREDDLDVFFEQQRDPEAMAMALMPAREREAFDAHWRRILADEGAVIRTIDAGGEVAGNVLSWQLEGRQLVGYWLGREFWGRGLATAALRELVQELGRRPLHAWVATSNLGSIRVLEKCGFERVGETSEHDERIGQVVEMFLYQLD
jgi:RimJ/RimL family protein N-acetyltransferase